jgi:hypothetical protein
VIPEVPPDKSNVKSTDTALNDPQGFCVIIVVGVSLCLSIIEVRTDLFARYVSLISLIVPGCPLAWLTED